MCPYCRHIGRPFVGASTYLPLTTALVGPTNAFGGPTTAFVGPTGALVVRQHFVQPVQQIIQIGGQLYLYTPK